MSPPFFPIFPHCLLAGWPCAACLANFVGQDARMRDVSCNPALCETFAKIAIRCTGCARMLLSGYHGCRVLCRCGDSHACGGSQGSVPPECETFVISASRLSAVIPFPGLPKWGMYRRTGAEPALPEPQNCIKRRTCAPTCAAISCSVELLLSDLQHSGLRR